MNGFTDVIENPIVRLQYYLLIATIILVQLDRTLARAASLPGLEPKVAPIELIRRSFCQLHPKNLEGVTFIRLNFQSQQRMPTRTVTEPQGLNRWLKPFQSLRCTISRPRQRQYSILRDFNEKWLKTGRNVHLLQELGR